ncbi:MAG: DUF2452 domain-containing protein [Chloroherpetonaceae bacterium]|nr:DUF2452 domain-containing protein [Chloroherpetonaceae bacterium]
MKENEIDVSKIELERMKLKTADTPGLLPYAHTSGSALIKPEDTGKIKGRAVSAMHEQTSMQMSQLYQQMELLAAQANAIKKRVEISERIYLAKMSFEPLIGHTYYLYRKGEDDILSLIAPGEWGRSKSFTEFVAKVKLLADHTWDILEGK